MIIIQARSTSKRLPNKIMEELGNKPIIRHVYNTCSSSGMFTIVAVPTGDKVIPYLKDNHIPFFEGSEEDVLARYYHCAITYKATSVLRVTADCPLLDLPYILYLQKMAGNVHYAEVKGIDGQNVELISFEALEKAHKEASSKEDREHVTTWIRGNKDLVPQAIHTIPFQSDKMSVDTEADLIRVRDIYANCHIDNN